MKLKSLDINYWKDYPHEKLIIKDSNITFGSNMTVVTSDFFAPVHDLIEDIKNLEHREDYYKQMYAEFVGTDNKITREQLEDIFADWIMSDIFLVDYLKKHNELIKKHILNYIMEVFQWDSIRSCNGWFIVNLNSIPNLDNTLSILYVRLLMKLSHYIQVIVFTNDLSALREFEILNAYVHPMYEIVCINFVYDIENETFVLKNVPNLSSVVTTSLDLELDQSTRYLNVTWEQSDKQLGLLTVSPIPENNSQST